jgi:hypothetical protein
MRNILSAVDEQRIDLELIEVVDVLRSLAVPSEFTIKRVLCDRIIVPVLTLEANRALAFNDSL